MVSTGRSRTRLVLSGAEVMSDADAEEHGESLYTEHQAKLVRKHLN